MRLRIVAIVWMFGLMIGGTRIHIAYAAPHPIPRESGRALPGATSSSARFVEALPLGALTALSTLGSQPLTDLLCPPPLRVGLLPSPLREPQSRVRLLALVLPLREVAPELLVAQVEQAKVRDAHAGRRLLRAMLSGALCVLEDLVEPGVRQLRRLARPFDRLLRFEDMKVREQCDLLVGPLFHRSRPIHDTGQVRDTAACGVCVGRSACRTQTK